MRIYDVEPWANEHELRDGLYYCRICGRRLPPFFGKVFRHIAEEQRRIRLSLKRWRNRER